MSSQDKLHDHIINLSQGLTWEAARAEWELSTIYTTEEPQTCPCGQYPINEICVIRNRKNGETTEVGNTCVNNFLKLPSKKLFDSLRYVRKDAKRSFSEEMIEYAYRNMIINEWEWKFYRNIRRDRILTIPQSDKKDQINAKIISGITRQ